MRVALLRELKSTIRHLPLRRRARRTRTSGAFRPTWWRFTIFT